MGINFSAYKILVVDDVWTNVLLLKVMLEQEKFNVYTALNSKEAKQHLEKESIDLILMDIMMPDVNGFELTEQLKSSDKYKDIPILFITALNSPEEIVKGFRLGANDFITKPFNKEELMMRVKHQISLIAAKKVILEQTEELRKVIQGRDRLYAVIAHDLRSPISALKMILNVMALTTKEKEIDAECVELLDSANEISEQIFALLDNLLKWTKAQLGMLHAVVQRFNLSEIAKGVVEVSQLTAKLKNVNIVLHAPDSVEVDIDTDMMKTILRNLITNAIKFSQDNSVIDLYLKIDGDDVVVEVYDNGKGISAEDQKALTDSLLHGTVYGAHSEDGSGLGLLITNQFIQLHRGSLFFHSEENAGSCFGFRIPIKHDSEA